MATRNAQMGFVKLWPQVASVPLPLTVPPLSTAQEAPVPTILLMDQPALRNLNVEDKPTAALSILLTLGSAPGISLSPRLISCFLK